MLPNITERSEPSDSDEWDDWYEYFDYFDGSIDKKEAKKIVVRFGLIVKHFFDYRMVKLSDGKQTLYLIGEPSAEEPLSIIKNIEQWVYDFSDYDCDKLGINIDKIYNCHVESSLEDLRKNPGTVYHWTTEEGWDLIQASGGMHQSRGTGLNNHGAYGIFTTVNPEEYVLGTYGEIRLTIDLDTFQRDHGLRELHVEFEPEVMDYLLHEYLRNVLDIENREDVPSDISAYTVVVNHSIPVKYIKADV